MRWGVPKCPCPTRGTAEYGRAGQAGQQRREPCLCWLMKPARCHDLSCQRCHLGSSCSVCCLQQPVQARHGAGRKQQ